jgi:hypothetical protein
MVGLKSRLKIMEVLRIYDECMTHYQNSCSIELWLQYVELLQSLEDVFSQLPGENVTELETERETKLRSTLLKAISSVGFNSSNSHQLWEQAIELEISAGNYALAFQLAYLGCETYQKNQGVLPTKISEILDSTLDIIKTSFNSPPSDIPPNLAKHCLRISK